MKTRNHFTLSLAALALTAASTQAALVASDLNDGGADTGFSDAWHNGSTNVFVTTDLDLTYAN